MSFVSAGSAAWLEQFFAWERLGDAADLKDRDAREVDAFAVLQTERRKWEAAAGGE